MNSKTAKRIRQLSPLLVLILVALAGATLLHDVVTFETVQKNRDILIEFRDTHLGWMAIGFLSFYILIVSFSLPGASVTSITGGFLFGLTLGTFLNVSGAAIGAIVIFSVVKAGLGKMVTKKIDRYGGRIAVLREQLHKNEVSVLLMLRLLPIVPFFVVNVISALVDVKLKNFAFTTVLGIIPGALVYTWIGVGIGDVFDQSGNPDLSLIWSPHVLGPLIGLAMLAGAPIIFRMFRSEES